jgi:hypothetical protein
MWDEDDWSDDYSEPAFNWYNLLFVFTSFCIYFSIYLICIYIKTFIIIFFLFIIILYRYNSLLKIKNKKGFDLNYNDKYYKKY